MTLLTNPPLTQTLGPWLAPTPGKLPTRLAREKDLMWELIDGLPPHDYFAQTFHRSVANWLPFYWKGFRQTSCYSYWLPDLSDERRLWDGLQENIRREIRKAERIVRVRSDADVDMFLRVNTLTFARQGLAPPSEELVRRLDAACEQRGARRIFWAEDAHGRVHGVLYLVWDPGCAYYLMGGGDPALRSSGAQSLIVWESIRFAARVSRSFDFEGSMIEPIERFFRAFGAIPQPLSEVSRASRRMRVLLAGRDLAGVLRRGRP
jgi:hypothetical protein